MLFGISSKLLRYVPMFVFISLTVLLIRIFVAISFDLQSYYSDLTLHSFKFSADKENYL